MILRLVREHAAALALGFAAVHFALVWLTLQPAPHTGGDNAAYITLARSLLERGAYLSLWDPAAPLHTQYPPGFPLILAAALLLGVQPWVGLKLVIGLLSASAVALTFLWLRRRTRPGLALGVTTVVALAPGVLEQAHWVLSDVPFWALTMLALWAFERLPPSHRGRLAVAVVATLVAYFTRSAGLPLVLAAAGWLALRGRWRALGILAAVVGVPAFLWWLRARGAGGVDYVSQFWMVNPYEPHLGRMGVGDFIQRVVDNDRKYLTLHLPILLTLRTGTLLTMLAMATAVLAVFGWVARLRRPAVAELFLPLYVGLLLVWPQVWSGERFLLPALPLLLAYAGEAFARAARAVRPDAGRWAGGVAVALLVLLGLPGLNAAARAGMACTADWRAGDRWACLPLEWRDFLGLAEWARDGLPEDAVVLSRKPRLFHLVSGRPGQVYPFTPYANDLFAAVDQAGAGYVVLDRVDAMGDIYLTPAILERTTAFCILRSSGPEGAAILGVRRGVPPDGDLMEEPGVVSFPVCDA
ncbi:MAG: hypothetical protein WEB88_02905, partial [Gemmatimonadota bacterium]